MSARERHVVGLLAEGRLNKEIAGVLLLTEGTVKIYVSRIFQKLSLSNRWELTLWWLSQKIEAADLDLEEMTLP